MPDVTLQQRPAPGAGEEEARAMAWAFIGEQLAFAQTMAGVSLGFVDVGNWPGLAYSLRCLKAHVIAASEVEADLARRLRGDVPAGLRGEGDAAAAKGKEALSAFWRGLTIDERHVVGGIPQRDRWAVIASTADDEQASRAPIEQQDEGKP